MSAEKVEDPQSKIKKKTSSTLFMPHQFVICSAEIALLFLYRFPQNAVAVAAITQLHRKLSVIVMANAWVFIHKTE